MFQLFPTSFDYFLVLKHVLGKMVTSFSSACLFCQLSNESEEEVENDGGLQTYNTRDMYEIDNPYVKKPR